MFIKEFLEVFNMIQLKDYQKKAIEGLKQKVKRVLNSPEQGIVIFQAPTGSGKTLMVSEMLKQLVKENPKLEGLNREQKIMFNLMQQEYKNRQNRGSVKGAGNI
ncbi:MAG TPA: ATPase, T2SS/T4P/T4SS family, partial [bacterium]|nr:ATPase, T2SS/T4P/T4SS family [bacterium]